MKIPHAFFLLCLSFAVIAFPIGSYATPNIVDTLLGTGPSGDLLINELPTSGKGTCDCCEEAISSCLTDACACQSTQDLGEFGIDNEAGLGSLWILQQSFILHREWLIKNVWEAHVLPSMMQMSEQITFAAMQQMQVIGTLFDAKHQLETQRLLQNLQTVAHKQYQPSDGMCRFGTVTRSIAASDRKAEVNQIAMSARNTERILLSANGIGTGGARDEERSRREDFRTTYCNPRDMGGALAGICKNTNRARMNKDINYTKTLYNSETLDIDFIDYIAPPVIMGQERQIYDTKTMTGPTILSPDEKDVLALAANLYGAQLMPIVSRKNLADADGNIIFKGAKLYLDTRAIAAKRSVAHNSFAAQVGMKAVGAEKAFPYMEEILLDMGIPSSAVEKMLKGSPSYYAQMEILTKKLYQNPSFYAQLYDKPVNIDRKNVSMQAIGLMQKRDIYRSQLRSEANSAIFLETLLEDLQEDELNDAGGLTENTRVLYNLGLGVER